MKRKLNIDASNFESYEHWTRHKYIMKRAELQIIILISHLWWMETWRDTDVFGVYSHGPILVGTNLIISGSTIRTGRVKAGAGDKTNIGSRSLG